MIPQTSVTTRSGSFDIHALRRCVAPRVLTAALAAAPFVEGCAPSCSGVFGGREEAPRCESFARIATNDVAVFRLGDDTQPQELPVTCGRPGCLYVAADAVAVRQQDGTTWAEWDGHPGAVLGPPPTSASMSNAERWARAQTDPPGVPRGLGGGTSSDPIAAVAAKLPPELRTCGSTRAGGGFGVHIIRNAGDVWQRIEWVVLPEAPEVKNLGPGSYPIADGTGGTCAVATQLDERVWQIRHLASGTIVDATPDHEHPPARCTGNGDVEVTTTEGSTLVHHDGGTTNLPPRESAREEVLVDPAEGEGKVIQAPGNRFRVDLGEGTTATFELRADADLQGRPMPAGARRTRLSSVTDGKRTVLVMERLELPDCTGRDLLWHATLEPNQPPALRLVVEGDAILGRLSWGLGRYWWTSSVSTLVDVSGAT